MTDSERLKELLASNPEFAKIWDTNKKEELEKQTEEEVRLDKLVSLIRDSRTNPNFVFSGDEAREFPVAILTSNFLHTFCNNMFNVTDDEIRKLYKDLLEFNVTVPAGYEECLEFKGDRYLMTNLIDDKGIYTKIIEWPEKSVCSI